MIDKLIMGQIDPTAFSVFGIEIYWYSIIIVSAIILAVFLAQKEAARVGLEEDDIIDFMFWALPLAIVGARLYYVLFEWRDYVKNPIEILYIRSGGLAIYGGLIAGGLVVYFFTQSRYISFWKFLDIAAPSVIIAQAIGRWGNFMNQEAYGGETSLGFLKSLGIPKFIRDNMLIDGAYRQPTFLYESVWNVIGFVLLLILRRKDFVKQGEIFLGYVIWYSFGRFFIEGMRTDSLWIFGVFRVSQLLSAVLFVAAIFFLVYRRRKENPPIYNKVGAR